MELKDKITVITGAASGIGKALAVRFKAEGAKLVVCADRNGEGARATAKDVGGVAFETDVSKEDDIKRLIETVEKDHGPIDLFFSNAGIGIGGGAEASNADWQRIWEINVMSHIWAARHLVPLMAARGGGYLVSTSSAAGLLSQIGSAPYAVTKHAAVGLAEWLAITHGDQGIKVSVLCPQAVRTAMTANGGVVSSVDGMLEPEQLADCVIETMDTEGFLILPHPVVLDYFRRKTADYDRWLTGMRRFKRNSGGGV